MGNPQKIKALHRPVFFLENEALLANKTIAELWDGRLRGGALVWSAPPEGASTRREPALLGSTTGQRVSVITWKGAVIGKRGAVISRNSLTFNWRAPLLFRQDMLSRRSKTKM